MKKFIFWSFILAWAVPSVHATWDVTTPAGSESKSLGDDRIRELKTDIQTSLRYEGDFPGPDTANPRFLYTPSTGTTSLRPTSSTNTAVGMLYVNITSGTIEQYYGNNEWRVIATTVPLAGTINVTQISTEIAGAGLAGGGGDPLRVNVDSNIFTITNDTITIKTGGVTSTELADTITIPTLAVTTQTWAGFGLLPILQVQTFTIATSSGGTGAEYFPSNVTVSITPKLSTSKILVVASGVGAIGAGSSGYWTIARNGSRLSGPNGYAAAPQNSVESLCMFAYDSPATTSATTYAVYMKNDLGVTVEFPSSTLAATASIMAIEIGQ